MSIILLFISLLFFMGINISIAISMVLSVFLYILLDGRFSYIVFGGGLIHGLDSFPLLAIPFYILAAEVMNFAKISDRIFDFASVLVGHIRGGLGHVNVLASMIMAGMSGSAVADIAGLGQIEIKAMKERGYDPAFSAAVTSVSATVGPIIPPSIPFVIYGVMCNVSVGHLFAAGMIPGILLGIIFMITIALMARVGLVKGELQKRPKMREILRTSIKALPPLFAIVILLGGIFLGAFTPTEAGAACVLYSFLLGFIYGDIRVRDIWGILKRAALASANVSFIIATASIFGWVVTQAQIGHKAYEMIEALSSTTWVVIILINIMMLIAGMFIEGIALLTISIPVLFPILPSIGMDPLTLGVLLTLLMMIGLLTPPVGVGSYIAIRIAQASAKDVFKAELPFYIPLIVMVLLISFVPSLTLYLPSLIFGSR